MIVMTGRDKAYSCPVSLTTGTGTDDNPAVVELSRAYSAKLA